MKRGHSNTKFVISCKEFSTLEYFAVLENSPVITY